MPIDPDRLSLLAGTTIGATSPALRVLGPTCRTEAVVLVLHGVRATSAQPTRPNQLAYRRMVPITRALHQRLETERTAVWLLRNRLRGWNEPTRDPILDAEWALAEIELRHPDTPIVLVGHSMGGRAALRVAGHPRVIAVCALAPWLNPEEPTEQLAGRTVLIAHGDRDRWTDPRQSLAYAGRAKTVTPNVCRFAVAGSGHAMLRRAADWTALITGFTAGVLGVAPQLPIVEQAMTTPNDLRVPLPR